MNDIELNLESAHSGVKNGSITHTAKSINELDRYNTVQAIKEVDKSSRKIDEAERAKTLKNDTNKVAEEEIPTGDEMREFIEGEMYL